MKERVDAAYVFSFVKVKFLKYGESDFNNDLVLDEDRIWEEKLEKKFHCC